MWTMASTKTGFCESNGTHDRALLYRFDAGTGKRMEYFAEMRAYLQILASIFTLNHAISQGVSRVSRRFPGIRSQVLCPVELRAQPVRSNTLEPLACAARTGYLQIPATFRVPSAMQASIVGHHALASNRVIQAVIAPVRGRQPCGRSLERRLIQS